MELESSFMHFLLGHQQRHNRTLNFVILMEAVLTAAKQIAHHYRLAELARTTAEAGSVNVHGESVMQLDELAHQILLHHLRESGQVLELTSEESEDPELVDENGRYILYVDPLDGSSNVKHSLPVGLLFGIAKRNLEGTEDCRLRRGSEFIAAGMFLLPSGQFTFALKNAGAWRFILDQTGTYVRPTPVILPQRPATWELSWNSGNRQYFSDAIQSWVSATESQYTFRYTGSLAVDFHRLLHNGGMFFYPAICQHPDASKNRPEGKLRLLYECNVVAFIAEEAGGAAIDERGEAILDVAPQSRHQRSTLFVGNRELVDGLQQWLAK